MNPPSLEVDTTVTQRFVAVHGRRSLMMGYPEKGLEIWAYPFQILEGYQIGFRNEGEASEADARPLLRRLIYAPDSVTRIYAGPDFVVREKLFVPLDRPAAVITFEINSRRKLGIVVHFTPVLNLMWPGALGGQVTQWNPAVHGYVISQFSEHLKAVIASPDIEAEDSTVNSTYNDGKRFSFSLKPRTLQASNRQNSSSASVFVALDASGHEDPAAVLQEVIANRTADNIAAISHYRDLQANSLQIETPDENVNAAVAWAQVALDQSWVCNPRLGCGLVAGYGPSREIRRPQYAWFFGGDGLAATNALIAVNDLGRAREELEFIIRYQDRTNGMIWHELSQSAGYMDWSKYPYMFVHVDITLDYLNTVARYVQASGDTAFARMHWTSLQAAYHYSRSLVDPVTHIPHIPPDKEGGDEQHRPYDDLGVAGSWAAAAQSFAELAELCGHSVEAQEASSEANQARSAVRTHFWDTRENFWIDGHTGDGAPIFTRRSGFTDLLVNHTFTPQQEAAVLDQLASSQFITDWGFRGAAPTPGYDPWSYTTAITSPLQSSIASLAFWTNHRPAIAEYLWRTILPLNTLDAPGHLLEVLAGDFYLEQTESVPEQTWSSAGFLDATLHGLFGLEVNGRTNTISFSPRLPADWPRTALHHLALPHATLDLQLQQSLSALTLSVQNEASAVNFQFGPHLPLGAQVKSAECNGKALQAKLSTYPQDQQASIAFEAGRGATTCHLLLSGGVSVMPPSPEPHIGDQNKGLKLTSVHLDNSVLSVEADCSDAARNTFRFRTPWHVANIAGATLHRLDQETYEVELPQLNSPKAHREVSISFEK